MGWWYRQAGKSKVRKLPPLNPFSPSRVLLFLFLYFGFKATSGSDQELTPAVLRSAQETVCSAWNRTWFGCVQLSALPTLLSPAPLYFNMHYRNNSIKQQPPPLIF